MLIKEKILGQIANLKTKDIDTIPYENLLSSMKSGDSENIE